MIESVFAGGVGVFLMDNLSAVSAVYVIRPSVTAAIVLFTVSTVAWGWYEFLKERRR